VPLDAKTLLFVADSAAEKRKGLGSPLEALRGLEGSQNFFFVTIGRGLEACSLSGKVKTIDPVGDEIAMSFLYGAADVFVVPSLQCVPNSNDLANNVSLSEQMARVGRFQHVAVGGYHFRHQILHAKTSDC